LIQFIGEKLAENFGFFLFLPFVKEVRSKFVVADLFAL